MELFHAVSCCLMALIGYCTNTTNQQHASTLRNIKKKVQKEPDLKIILHKHYSYFMFLLCFLLFQEYNLNTSEHFLLLQI